jgi:hypothetical protein
MAAVSPATRLVNRAARQVLWPMVFGSKGDRDVDRRSRVVAGGGRIPAPRLHAGTYLNVGVNWLWWAEAHLSFDYGHRVRWTTTTDPIRPARDDRHTSAFVAYHDEHQIDDEVQAVCQAAITLAWPPVSPAT